MDEKITMTFTEKGMRENARASLRAIIRHCDRGLNPDASPGEQALAKSVLTLATFGLAKYPPLLTDGPLFDDDHPR